MTEPAADETSSGTDPWYERITKALTTGVPLDLTAVDGSNDPTEAADWPDERAIPAEVLVDAIVESVKNKSTHHKGLRIIGARIDGRIDIDHVEFRYPLKLMACAIPDGASAELARLSRVSLNRSAIGRGLTASETTDEQSPDTAPVLNFDGADIAGHLFTLAAIITGTFRAVGATIGGQLVLNGAHLDGDGNNALTLYQAHITGSVFANDGFTATGTIQAVGATIDGEMSLNGAHLDGDGNNALTLDRAHITGSVFANDGFTATGTIRAISATIDGQLSLNGAHLDGDGNNALTLERATIRHLVIQNLDCTGVIDLAAADVTVISGPEEGHPPSALVAVGWQITTLTGAIGRDWTVARDWLETSPVDFHPQPWYMTADVYEKHGHLDGARKLRHTAATKTTEQGKRATRWRGWIYDRVAGHGYYPWRSVYYLLLIVVVTAGLTWCYRSDFVPTAPAVAADTYRAHRQLAKEQPVPAITGEVACAEIDPYPCLGNPLNVIAYAAANSVTGPTTGIADWRPSGLLSLIFLVLRLTSWILTAILIAGVTGVLKKT